MSSHEAWNNNFDNCLIFISCWCDKIPWRKQLKKERTYLVTILGYSPSWQGCPKSRHKNLKQLVTLCPQSRTKHSELLHVHVQCSACFLYSSTIQYPLPSEWCHPLWVCLPTNQTCPQANLIQTIPHRDSLIEDSRVSNWHKTQHQKSMYISSFLCRELDGLGILL